MSRAPNTYRQFAQEFPKLSAAWDLLREAEAEGPIDRRTARLLKLAIAIGAMREGAVSSAVRKARDEGVSDAEIAQIIALAASTLGLPSTVAVWSWVRLPPPSSDPSGGASVERKG